MTTTTTPAAAKQSYSICFCFRRKFKVNEAEAPAEVKSLFDQFSDYGIMTADHLLRFMREVQGDDKVTREDIEVVMEGTIKELKHRHLFHRKVFHLDAFFRFLFCEANSPIPPPWKVGHDMTAPLAHYFIYTGHNSYLTGNQISSDSSDVPIIEALQRGVRVIELDMWPNSKKDDIDIVHGGTLTAPVGLMKCLKSIKEYAFVASEYPVIITLEDHLTPDLQAKVATMVTQTLGDVLFCDEASESLSEFPSPESLKRKIVISTKPPKEFVESKSMKEKDNDLMKVNDSPEKDDDAWGNEVSIPRAKYEPFDENELDDGEFQEEEEIQKNAAPEYKSLIAIHAKKLKGGIKDWLHMDNSAVRRISLRETRLEKASIDHGKDVVRFTQSNLLRVFPKGTRVDSSNYNPFIGWMHGAQMVAFNMQGTGRPLWLMHGMFRGNGGCGYVKKPDFLLTVGPDNKVFDPKKSLPVKKTLKVKVYMGDGWHLDFHRTHFDVYSPPDFYVRVGIAGFAADTVMKKTRTIENDWTPTWDEEFEFPLTVPELALLRVEVHEYDMSEKDDFGGQTCLPVSELRTGIRSVPLHDQKGNKYKSVKLLMKFEFV